MSRRRQAPINQLDLISDDGPGEGWWNCHGIFTRPYLKQHLTNPEHVPSADEVRPLFEKLKARWLDNLPGLRRQGEPYTRTKFLDPTLLDLGWPSFLKRIFLTAERENALITVFSERRRRSDVLLRVTLLKFSGLHPQ